MEPTVTQNSALYFAQHKLSKRRAALFKKFRAAARKQGPDVRRQLTFGDLFIGRRVHQDNGR
jgi:hypothetical protein